MQQGQCASPPEVPEAQLPIIPRSGDLVGLLSSKVNVADRHCVRLRDLCCPLQGAHIPHLNTGIAGGLRVVGGPCANRCQAWLLAAPGLAQATLSGCRQLWPAPPQRCMKVCCPYKPGIQYLLLAQSLMAGRQAVWQLRQSHTSWRPATDAAARCATQPYLHAVATRILRHSYAAAHHPVQIGMVGS